MEIKSLIERIEKSEGADRELDGAIALSLGWTLQKMKGDARPYYRKPGATQYYNRAEPPAYTASIDAAMTLVPEHSLFTVRTLWDDSKTAGLAVVSRYEGERRFWMGEHQSVAATPALALCAAALKARNPSHEG